MFLSTFPGRWSWRLFQLWWRYRCWRPGFPRVTRCKCQLSRQSDMNNKPGFRMRVLRQGAALCLCSVIAGGAAYGASPDAHQIMEDVYRQDTSRGTFMRASFEVSDKDGHRTKKEFTYRRIRSE